MRLGEAAKGNGSPGNRKASFLGWNNGECFQSCLRAKVDTTTVGSRHTYPGRHSVSREHALLGQHSADAHRYRIHPERFLDDRLRVSGSFQNFFRDRCTFVGQQVARFGVHFLLRVRVRRQMVQPETARIRALFNSNHTSRTFCNITRYNTVAYFFLSYGISAW